MEANLAAGLTCEQDKIKIDVQNTFGGKDDQIQNFIILNNE